MITLKAPIELKTRSDFMKDHESFGERIAGNYALTGIEIGAEELLHIVSSPPEIYVAEGGATTIAGTTLISSRNEERLDIINNMLNRIMLSVNTELSYQDRAFITDTLYKIGIKDDRKFMSEVRRMMNESRLEDAFINDYLVTELDRENEELRRETLELSREIVERGLAEGITLREESLSRSIMRRLQTGAIYQIVANFNKSLDETRVNLAEQLISEQENTAKEMLVQSFLSNMVREGADIVLREEQVFTEGEDTAAEAMTGAGDTLKEHSEVRERLYSAGTESFSSESESSVFIASTEREGAEIIYREETAGSGEEEDSGSEARQTEEGSQAERIPYGVRETLELQSTVRESAYATASETTERERAEIIYREQEPSSFESADTERVTERLWESVSYITRNIYERELRSESLKESEVQETINAAVLYDIVRNLYHTGYERITKSNAWTEYRGALFRSSENTINRVSNTSYESSPLTRYSEVHTGGSELSLDYTEFEELSEIEENEGNIELIENQIRQMNEMNLRNVSRYEQMREILKKLEPEKRAASSGRERTRREALRALEDERAILRSLEEGEGEQEARRREVFHEITRLFPDNAAQVFNVIEQYLENPAAVQDMGIVSGHVAEAAEEIMRLQQASERAAQPVSYEEIPPVGEGLVFKREDRLTEDKLTEILDTYRHRENIQRQDISNTQDINEARTINSTTVTQNVQRNLTERELANIEDMVNRGVRSQMGAISEQVLSKLEKRLRNEKSRRGI